MLNRYIEFFSYSIKYTIVLFNYIFNYFSIGPDVYVHLNRVERFSNKKLL